MATLASTRPSDEPAEDAYCGRQLYRDGSGASAGLDDERDGYDTWKEAHPCLLSNFHQLEAALSGKLLAVFLDYDGTLTPIVSDPNAAALPEATRQAVRSLARLFPTAIVSGRSREKVQQFVQLRELYYAGSHGMDIIGPHGAAGAAGLPFQPAAQYEPLMQRVCRQLAAAVAPIPGASVEDNKFCLSVHFRNCQAADFPAVVAAVERVVAGHAVLRLTRGRKVLEVRPHVDWDKGAALLHLLHMLGLGEGEAYCLYIGDDRTDEDAFRLLAERALGGGVLVSSRAKPTAGRWTLRDPGEVALFLERLVAWGASGANAWHARGECNGWKIAVPAGRNGAMVPAATNGLDPVGDPCLEKRQQPQQPQQQRQQAACGLPPRPSLSSKPGGLAIGAACPSASSTAS